MGAAEIITILTSVLTGIAKVANVTRESLAKSLEEMAAGVRRGELIPEELVAKVDADASKLKNIRDSLPD